MTKRVFSFVLAMLTVMTTVVLLSATLSAADPTFKAVWNDSDKSLTFYYDNVDHSGDGITVYDNLPAAAKKQQDWEYAKLLNSITEEVISVVIDPSVARYTGLTSTAYMFDYFTHTTSFTGAEYLNLSNVTNMGGMFMDYAMRVTEGPVGMPDVSSWDTSKVTDMHSLFLGVAAFSKGVTGVPDISGWDTSKVTNMDEMFHNFGMTSKNLEFTLDLSSWDTSNVTTCKNMFLDAGKTTDASKWNVKVPAATGTKANTETEWFIGTNGTRGSITPPGGRSFVPSDPLPKTFKAVFASATDLLTFYYDNKTHGANDSSIFLYDLSECTDATLASDWPYDGNRGDYDSVVIDPSVKNYTGLTSTAYMLSGMVNANGISGAEYLNVSNVTNMSSMFADFGSSSTAIAAAPDVSGWDTGNVTNMEKLFSNYGSSSSNLNFTLNLACWDVSKVTNGDSVFDFAGSVASTWKVYISKNTGTQDNTEAAWFFGENGENGSVAPLSGKAFTPVLVLDGRSFQNEIATPTDLQGLATGGGGGYLTDTVTLTSDLTIQSGEDLALYLNGKVLNLGGHHIVVEEGGKLSIYDCDTTTVHKFSTATDLWVLDETNGTAQVTGGVITGGWADQRGGAVYAKGTFVLAGGSLVGNESEIDGGAVYLYGSASRFTMSGGAILGNTADDCGGGVYVTSGGTFVMTGGKISGNTSGSGGGGVYAGDSSSFTMINGEISDNTANNNGGGVYVTGGTFVMTGGEISENTAAYNGGGVYAGDSSSFTMINGEISDNTANNNGGGVYVTGGSSVTLTGGTISGNTADGGGAVYAGGGSSVTLTGGTISGNTAKYGGGMQIYRSELGIFGGTIKGNQATDSTGGGINADNATVGIFGGEISDNTAATIGGGLHIYYSTFLLRVGDIKGNRAENGGGIAIGDAETVSVQGGTIAGNTATNGGGIYVYGIYGPSAVSMSGNSMSGNTAKRGGAIYNSDGSFFGFTGATIDGCTAELGGAVYNCGGSRFEASGGKILNCKAEGTADSCGGAVYNETWGGTGDHNTVTLANGITITNCTATKFGGAIYNDDVLGIETVTVSGNKAGSLGGGVYMGATARAFVGKVAKVVSNTLCGTSTVNNLYLRNGAILTVGTGADVPAPEAGMDIRISTETAPAPDAPVAITTNGTAADVGYFGSDVTGQSVKLIAGRLVLFTAKPMGNDAIVSISEQTYTGSAITPTVTVKDGDKTLTLNTDYTVEYSNNTSVGTATVTVKFIGNYSGTGTARFTIKPADPGPDQKPDLVGQIISIGDQEYTGSPIVPDVKVCYGARTLRAGTDYMVTYQNNIAIGRATVTVTFKGEFSGTVRKTFEIVPKTLGTEVIGSIADQPYTGAPVIPAVTVKDGAKTLTEGVDYTVSYHNNTEAGTAVAEVIFCGNYSGTAETTFKIAPKGASGITVQPIGAQPYTGVSITPDIKVMDGSKVLIAGTDYTVSYRDNTNAGTATVAVSLTGNYAGTVETTFTISPKALTESAIPAIEAQTYTGSPLTPAVTVKVGETMLNSGIDYTVSYQNNTDIGTATVLIAFRGNYTGTASASFVIKAASLTAGDSGEKEARPVVMIEAENGFDPNVVLEVEVVVKADKVVTKDHEATVAYEELAEKNEKVAGAYDVRLLLNGAEIQPDDLGNGTILTVRMLIPEHLLGGEFRLLHVHDAGDVLSIVPGESSGIGTYVIDEEGYLVTRIDRLSEFAFFYRPDCGMHWAMIAVLILFVAAFAVFTFVKKNVLIVRIACGACGVAAIVLAFFGGCGICTVFTVIDLVVIAAGAVWSFFGETILTKVKALSVK